MRRSTGLPRTARWIAWCVLACLPALTSAANRLSELEQALARATPAEKSVLLVQLSAEIEADNMDRSWDYAQQARREARAAPDEIRADARLAALQRRRGEYAAALATATAALPRAASLHDDRLRAELLLVIANTHASLSDYPTALEFFRQVLPLAEATGDARFLARVYNILGIAYADAKQPDLARPAYLTALRHAEKAGDQRQMASTLNNLGNMALEADDLVQARLYHERTLALREAIGGDTRGLADSHLNLAIVADAEGHAADALPHFEKAIALHQSLGLKRNLANARLAYASALRTLGRTDDALAQLRAGEQLAGTLGSPTVMVRVYRGYAEFYEARGEYQTALAYERKRAEASDAAVGERSRQRFDLLQARYDAERRDHEIDVLRRDQSVQQAELATVRWQRYGLLAVLAAVLIAAGAVINRQRIQRRAEQRIHAETRAARDAAQQADALKTRLLHMVSHDVRAPLGNILFLTEDLRHTQPETVAPDERFALIEHEAQRILQLAQDLLDSAALEAGRLSLRPAALDLADVIRTSLHQLTPLATAKGQTLEFNPPTPRTGLLTGDAARLAQIFTNLATNALKYSPRNARIRVGLERRDQRVLLAVTDQGPGIPPEVLPRLFQPFAQSSAKPTGGESSHGLGLSIAQDLARLHGGQITVHSPPGQGATFTLELPAG